MIERITNTPSALRQPKQTNQAAGFADKLDQAVKQAQPGADDKKLRQTCREMESVFINYMLTQMRTTVPKSTLLGNSSQKEIFQSLLDTELSKNMSQAGGIGLADMVYRQLSQNSKKSQAPK